MRLYDNRSSIKQCAVRIAFAGLLLACAALSSSAASDVAPTPDALAQALKQRRSVLLGEVHDNGVQHRLRYEAIKQRIDAGDRPALAFEQFDRGMQAEIDRVRREQPRDADALIAAAGSKNWDWPLYRPFVQLALDYELPIVAANLSRADAMGVATSGWNALFDEPTRSALALDRLPAGFVAAHEEAVARGHCDLLPASALPAMARAQIARDIVLAQSIRPQLARGVVLLTGNGHARKDIGVARWLDAAERDQLYTIGMLETGSDEKADLAPGRFDAVVWTAPAERPDPCEALRKRMKPAER